MDINIDENQDTSHSEEMNPVNLVTRIKHEAQDPPSNLKDYSDMSDFVNSFRKRRRGRGRYVPYLATSTFEHSRTKFSCSNNNTDSSKKFDALYPGPSMNCKHFSCPNCKVQFQNRDSLAMHMMESVRLEGCQSQKTSVDKSNSNVTMLDQNVVSRTPFTTNFENGCREKSVYSTSNNNSNFHELSRDRSLPPSCFLCKVCSEAFLNLDALAMHMFVHVQQETISKEPLLSTNPNTLISSNSMLPLPETIWSNQFNSSLYLKSFLATAIPDKPKSQYQNPSSLFDSMESNKSHLLNKFDIASQNGNGETIIERNCKSAPICNETIGTKLYNRDSKEKFIPLSSNGGSDKLPYSPNNVKESFDSDIQFLSKLHRCNHCRILFEDITTYCLHMGLHNVNNPWQCNMCGRKCSDLHDFTVHSLHF